MTSDPLVSVVTPVYNGAAYLDECVQSIIAQQYTNWELTIVDNASDDATPDIAAAYERIDGRIRHLRFEELVDATENHNRAFRAINPDSEFCKVVQADDWIYPECLTRMVAAGLAADTIGVVGAYRLWGAEVDLVGLPYRTTFARGNEVLRQCLLGGPYLTGAPTALLLRSRLVSSRDPFYQAGYRHDDTEAAYWLLSRSDFGYVHQVLTFARRQRGSRLEKAETIGTYVPENLRFLFRYGPLVLDRSEQRPEISRQLRSYVRFHVGRAVKSSRSEDREFVSIHLAETSQILEECGGDPEVRAAMTFVRAILRARGRRCVSPRSTGARLH